MAGTVSKWLFGLLAGLTLTLVFTTLIFDLKSNYPDISGSTNYTTQLSSNLDSSLGNLSETSNKLYDKISNPEESTALDITFLLARTVTTALNIIFIKLPIEIFIWFTIILGITGLSEGGKVFALLTVAVVFGLVFWIIKISTRSDV